MAKFPALPATVDRCVREFLNRLAGRSGNAGDKAVLHGELAELGLAKEKGQRLRIKKGWAKEGWELKRAPEKNGSHSKSACWAD